MIEKKTIETPLGIKRTYFMDFTNIREYRRITGGISWPKGEQPGFLCVVGEDEHKKARIKQRDLWLLTEYQNNDVQKLIKRCYDMTNRFMVENWYSNTEDLIMMQFVDRFNSKLSKTKKGIYLSEPPFVDDTHNLRLYATQIRDKVLPGKKSLMFGEGSVLPGVLLSLSPEDVFKKKAEDFPPIQALGHIISGLDEPYFDISRDRQAHELYVQRRDIPGL